MEVSPAQSRCGLPLAGAEALGLDPTRLHRIDAALQRHVDSGGITGAAFAFARRGRLAHYGAVGFTDPITRTPLAYDALYQTYSSTKVVAAVAMAMLLEEGLIRLSDPVSRYFAEFAGAQVAVRRGGPAPYTMRPPGEPPPPFDLVPARRDITVQDLITHTAGLMTADPRRVGMAWPRREPGTSLADYARSVGQVPLDFHPGERWSYSGLVGCDVLAGLLEEVTGQTFEAFIQARILDPLGMSETFFNVPENKRHRLLPVFRRADDAWVRLPPDRSTEAAALEARNPASGSMGLVSTADDLLRLQQMLADRGRSQDGEQLLGSRTVELIGTNLVGSLYVGEGAYAKPMYGHGFGLLVQVVLDAPRGETGRSNGAFGWGGAFGTMNWTDPAEGIAGVLMLQQNNREAHIDYERAIRQAIVD
jgi:CubicO group peptidase (beta-lactamase class C family)